jgi:hypothetical protein
MNRRPGHRRCDAAPINHQDLAPADNLIHAGQAACRYSWRTPPSRSWRRMSSRDSNSARQRPAAVRLPLLVGPVRQLDEGAAGAASWITAVCGYDPVEQS